MFGITSFVNGHSYPSLWSHFGSMPVCAVVLAGENPSKINQMDDGDILSIKLGWQHE